MTSNNSNVSQQTQTRVAFCAFLFCSAGFLFRTKPEKVVLENIVVGNWKLPSVTLAMQRSVSGRYGISRKLINPQFKHLGLLCEDFGIAKAAGGVWWCRLPAGCERQCGLRPARSHRWCSEPSCCRQRCPGCRHSPCAWPAGSPPAAGLEQPLVASSGSCKCWASSAKH